MMEANDLQGTLSALAEPLREQLAAIDKNELALIGELGKLRVTRRRIKGVLAQLDPETPAPKRRRRGRPVSGDRAEAVLAFVQTHNGDLSPDFNYTRLHELLRADGVGMKKESVRSAVLELERRGLLRLTRRSSGGGRQYELAG